jgi:putative drug exporter of the RND superfamily
MSVIARWCFRHRFAVIAAWVLALVALTALAQAVKSEYNNSFSLPGTGSTTAQQLLASTVPAQSGTPTRSSGMSAPGRSATRRS